eukprot:20951_1
MSCNLFGIIGIGICNTIIHLLAITSAIWFVHRFIKAYKVKKSSDKCLYYTGLLYFIIIILAFIMYCGSNIFYCINPSMASNLARGGIVFYTLQYILLIPLLFYRLCFIFKDTKHALSHCFILLFYCTFISLILSTICVAIANATTIADEIEESENKFTTMDALAFLPVLLVLSLIVMLIGSFIFKLTKIFKSSTARDHQMIRVAVKTFILTVCSIISLVFFACIQGIRISGNIDDVRFEFMFFIALDMDLCTNFISIGFGYAPFKDYYLKLCGVCNALCISCCAKKGDIENDVQLARVGSVSKPSSIGDSPVTPQSPHSPVSI